MNLNFNWFSKAAKGALTFGKKNLPAIMTGASIAGFWITVILIAKEAPEAVEEIKYDEETKERSLNIKEKAIIYGKHCWKGGLVGLASTGLGIGAQGISLERLAGAYMLAQMYKDDGDKLKKQILKQEDGPKQLENLRKAVLEEDFPDDVVDSYVQTASGDGNTLIIDVLTGARWKGNIVDVMSGIDEANEDLRSDYKRAKKRVSAFSAKDGPHCEDDYDPEVFGSLSVDEFLEYIGMPIDCGIETIKMGNLLEFRCYSDANLLKPRQILRYKPYTAPGEDTPKVCFLDYSELLGPSSELLERYP